MVRDERQIAAERDYAVEEARKETWAKAHEEGRAEGLAEGKIEMAKGLKTAGIDIETISRCSGLSIAEVEAL